MFFCLWLLPFNTLLTWFTPSVKYSCSLILPLMYSISLYHHTTMHLSILLFLCIRLASLLGLSWTAVLWITLFMPFGEHVTIRLLGIYLEMGFLGYKAHGFLNFTRQGQIVLQSGLPKSNFCIHSLMHSFLS